jgi:hypothetical protein
MAEVLRRLGQVFRDHRRTTPVGHRSDRWPPARTVLVMAAVVPLLAATACGSKGAEVPPGPVPSAGGVWVSTQGDDGGPGTAARPWRTISHAVSAAPAGSAIFVRTGTYQPFTVSRKGLTVTSAPGERATIQGVAGIRDNVLITADNVTVTDLTITGCVPKPNPDVNVNGDHGSGIRVDKTQGVTVRNVIVHDSRGNNAAGLPVGCYGILATESRNLLVTSSETYHNGAGIVITGGGRGVVVENNNVHDQDVIVQNSAATFDDFGGYGLAATFVTDKPGPVFRGNTVVRNFGPSTDYGVDGGGVELYDAANTTVSGNTFSDNDGVLETGTGSRGRCADDVFSDNTVTGRSTKTGLVTSAGMVLRCASNMVIRNNTFTDIDEFAFLLSSEEPFAGSVDGLQIVGNTVSQRDDAVVYRVQFGKAPTPPLTVDQNRYRITHDRFAVIDDGSETTVSFDDWKAWTGSDSRSSLF